MQDVLDNNVTLRSDTVVHVWKWWPVKSRALTDIAADDFHFAESHQKHFAASDQSPSQHTSQPASNLYTKQPSQHPGRKLRQQSRGPANCQLSKGCPGEVGSYSAGEDPGWFPEMVKVTAQVGAASAHLHSSSHHFPELSVSCLHTSHEPSLHASNIARSCTWAVPRSVSRLPFQRSVAWGFRLFAFCHRTCMQGCFVATMQLGRYVPASMRNVK